MAASRSKENGSSDVIEALIPKTGGIFFFDAMGILKEAKHPKNALAFMDFYLRPQYAAAMTNDFNYPTGNKAAADLLKPEVAQNKSVSMSEADIQKLIFTGALSVAARSNMQQAFVTINKGKSPTHDHPTPDTSLARRDAHGHDPGKAQHSRQAVAGGMAHARRSRTACAHVDGVWRATRHLGEEAAARGAAGPGQHRHGDCPL